jgi:hypothetical protein
MRDVGLIPWVPLAKFEGSPETIVSRCRARIDEALPSIGPVEHENLLAVTQFFLPLRCNEDASLLERLRALLGGRQAMIESLLYQQVVEEAERKGATEAKREAMLSFLMTRFGPAVKELEVELKAVEFGRLDDLIIFVVECRNLASFRKRLLA